MAQRPTVLPEDLFTRRSVDPYTGCWNWTGSVFDDGYGRLNYQGKSCRVHRLSMHTFRRFDLHSKKLVLHHCHNRLCFNPDHLYKGTHQTNMDDMYAAGRGPVGERAGLAKLTENQVKKIRRRYVRNSRGPNNQQGLAQLFDVAQTIISRVVRRETWRHV